jgi:hypothetical protein
MATAAEKRRAASLRPFQWSCRESNPFLGAGSLSQTGTELRNDMHCDSPELTSVDTECAQNVPSQSPTDSAQLHSLGAPDHAACEVGHKQQS